MSRRAKEYPGDPIRQAWFDWRTQNGLLLNVSRVIETGGYTFVVDPDTSRVTCCVVVEDAGGPTNA